MGASLFIPNFSLVETFLFSLLPFAIGYLISNPPRSFMYFCFFAADAPLERWALGGIETMITDGK